MDLGAPELIIILVIVLLIFGPGRIVKIARELGTGIHQFKSGLETTTSEAEKPEEKTKSDS